MVRAMTELENNVVAVERVQEYVEIESEVSRVYIGGGASTGYIWTSSQK